MVYHNGRLIAHAGGAIGHHRYTNTLEAFEASRRSVSLIEMDVCSASDGLIVAHDGLEANYGLESKFADITIEEFRASL